MLERARLAYPQRKFLQGDATRLPLPDATIDIVVDGAALIHIGDTSGALGEYSRVARQAVILHSVTCTDDDLEVLPFEKRAYGERVLEYAFGRRYLENVVHQCGLVVERVLPGLDYDLLNEIGLPTVSETWVLTSCR